MWYLLSATLLWAIPFGLIRANLVAMDPSSVALWRIALAALAFAPFIKALERRIAARWMLLGALQIGLMYVLYIRAYQYLEGHQVAMLTITTPIFVVLLSGWRRALQARVMGAAVLAVLAAYLLIAQSERVPFAATGVILMQFANLCFAYGQVAYRRHFRAANMDQQALAWMYLGALTVPVLALGLGFGDFQLPSTLPQSMSLLFLGLVPTGLGFLLWNRGARKVVPATLAVTNNLKIPMATAVAVLGFKETVAWWPFLASAAVFTLAFWLAGKTEKPSE